jgi:hypothetical protein
MYAYEHNHQFQLMVLAAPAGIFLYSLTHSLTQSLTHSLFHTSRYTWPSIKRSFISPTIKFLEMTSSLTVDTSDPNHILIQEFIMDKIEEYESKRYYRNATSHVKATIKQSKKTWQALTHSPICSLAHSLTHSLTHPGTCSGSSDGVARYSRLLLCCH